MGLGACWVPKGIAAGGGTTQDKGGIRGGGKSGPPRPRCSPRCPAPSRLRGEPGTAGGISSGGQGGVRGAPEMGGGGCSRPSPWIFNSLRPRFPSRFGSAGAALPDFIFQGPAPQTLPLEGGYFFGQKWPGEAPRLQSIDLKAKHKLSGPHPSSKRVL